MSRNRIRFDGMAELRQALRTMPSHLTEEASNIVEHTAQQAKGDVQAAYPTGPTGNLKRLVTISRQSGGFVTGAVVKNRAPHAYIYEHGTQVRHTDAGWNRGVMPPAGPGRAFIPIVMRHRRAMFAALKSMLERNGLKVGGDAV